MQLIVQKFGGTSVVSSETRQLAAQKIAAACAQGYSPVVVVSAMGRKGDPYATDTLLGLVRSTYKKTAGRELDQIMCCGEIISTVIMAATLQAAGLNAIALTGGQAGITTDNNFNNARILQVNPAHILSCVEAGKIPVVCGFQGITGDGDFTTLGRGGSDTSAAALGAALGAEKVEIYTDVDGIMTADPRIVNNAKILDMVSYEEICQLAQRGAKVIHPRAVEIAMQKSIPLVIKSTFSDAPGTLITNIPVQDAGAEHLVTDRIATGVTYLNSIAQLMVRPETEHSQQASFNVFKSMAECGINVDLININPGEIRFTLHQDNLDHAIAILQQLGYEVQAEQDCAKVSVVGGGMREVPGVMASFVEALVMNDIAILQTVDSDASISALIKKVDVEKAVKALHEKFALANS
ncbi:MAG: ask [Firmicutes bacterium]|nr:ask [Bacillota bacterium]